MTKSSRMSAIDALCGLACLGVTIRAMRFCKSAYKSAKIRATSACYEILQRYIRSRDVRYLAYPEQLQADHPIFVIGGREKARWIEALCTSRGYCVKLVSEASRGEIPGDSPIVIASLAPSLRVLARLLGWLTFSRLRAIWDATELFSFVNERAAKDTTGILLGDLAVAYDRTNLEDMRRYGATWRRIPRLPTDQYVRNIETRYGRGSRFVVNIGSHDGKSGDPCYPLYHDGWRGWAVDGVQPGHPTGIAARETFKNLDVELTLGTFVTPHNVRDLMRDHRVPVDCDLIKVDIDSYDGAVIQAIVDGGWRPRVFCVEINADFPPPFRFLVNYTDKEMSEYKVYQESGLYGCSAAWAADLFLRNGYRFARYDFGFPFLIGGIRDMIFVRGDVFSGSGATEADWVDAYYGEPLGWSHVRKGLGIDPRQWRHVDDYDAFALNLSSRLRDAAGRQGWDAIDFTLTV